GIALKRYELRGIDEHLLGTASFWAMQPLSSGWGVTAAGLLHVGIEGPRRRQGFANYLVAESLHDLAVEGVTLAEAQVSLANEPALSLFTKLGFETVAHGSVFRKPAGTPGPEREAVP
ncbi:MAG: N-acetyltransferase family protein, partial [Planctomycetia bacterium]